MNNYKKILLGVVTFCILLVILDCGIGHFSKRMYYKSKYGIFHRQIYCMYESNDELLILGSSRAAHHYVPTIFTDSLGYSCYNAGSDGMCIYYQYAILTSYIHRNAIPKIVICEVVPQDAEVTNGPTFNLDAALDRLAPHYGEVSEIDSLFKLNGWKESIKLSSNCYRYNSKLVQSIKCNYIPSSEDHGYEARIGEMIPKDTKQIPQAGTLNKIDSIKLDYFSKVINICRNNQIRLIICYSPMYNNTKSNGIDVLKQIANNHAIPFLDYSSDMRIRDCRYFNDETHLNDEGAHLYSSIVAHDLKLLFSN
jgi:hypothetical protein